MKSEDVLILLKLVAIKGTWSWEYLSSETGHEVSEICGSIENLRKSRLISELDVNIEDFKDFILFGIHYLFPAKPGNVIKGLSTGAKPGMFFTKDLPYTSLTVWPYEFGKEEGFAVEPLSPHCCFAALNDPQLRKLLAITETMRIVGREARPWAASELSKFLEMNKV